MGRTWRSISASKWPASTTIPKPENYISLRRPAVRAVASRRSTTARQNPEDILAYPKEHARYLAYEERSQTGVNLCLCPTVPIRAHQTGFAQENDRIVPRFFIESIEDQLASQREGRPIFYDQERVELMIPGISQYNIKVDIVDESHRNRWPDQSQEIQVRIRDFVRRHSVGKMGDPQTQPCFGTHGAELRDGRTGCPDGRSDHLTAVRHGWSAGCVNWLGHFLMMPSTVMRCLTKATADSEQKDAKISELTHKVDELTALLTFDPWRNADHG